MSTEYIPRLKIKYEKEVRFSLADKLNISNSMRIPKLIKVVLYFPMYLLMLLMAHHQIVFVLAWNI